MLDAASCAVGATGDLKDLARELIAIQRAAPSGEHGRMWNRLEGDRTLREASVYPSLRGVW